MIIQKKRCQLRLWCVITKINSGQIFCSVTWKVSSPQNRKAHALKMFDWGCWCGHSSRKWQQYVRLKVWRKRNISLTSLSSMQGISKIHLVFFPSSKCCENWWDLTYDWKFPLGREHSRLLRFKAWSGPVRACITKWRWITTWQDDETQHCFLQWPQPEILFKVLFK